MNTGLSLAEFKNKIADLARPNRFEVQIFLPTVMNTGFTDKQLQLISWTAETAQIPTRTQGEIPIKFHGMEYKLPGDYSKENLTIGFINTYGWEGRNYFETWMEYIQETSNSNKRESAFSMLSDSTLIVKQVGRTNEILASYKFFDVYPTNITAIELNMGEYDSIEKFTVNFSYSHYINELI